MSQSDDWKAYDAGAEFQNDLRAENEYLDIPVFESWNRVYQSTTRLFHRDDASNIWIEAPDDLFEDLEERK